MIDPAQHLPPEVVRKASLIGWEYAWPTGVIPSVVKAAAEAEVLVCSAILQYRISAGVCELYGIEFDIYDELDRRRPWDELVGFCAERFMERFAELNQRWDFHAEGMKWPDLKTLADSGQDISAYQCFMLDMESEESLRHLDETARRWPKP